MSQFIVKDADLPHLVRFVTHQLNNFFPDFRAAAASDLHPHLNQALERTRLCFEGIAKPKYRIGDDVLFNYCHPDHYAAFLYLASNVVSRSDRCNPLAFRLFSLNKALHGLDAYPDIELPEVFQFMHPLGTVLGHARYGNHFCVYQGCSVGSDEDGEQPVLGEYVLMYAGASIIGKSRVGNNVVLGTRALVLNETVADNTLVKWGGGHSVKVENSRHVRERRFSS